MNVLDKFKLEWEELEPRERIEASGIWFAVGILLAFWVAGWMLG